MEREFKINDLSKEIKRVQTENLHLLEEKQHVISENENLRREFEAMTIEKERKQQDVFHSFDPSSPLVLQRQIMNLKNQINDLQEANENAVLELSKADEEISQQRKDLAKLKSEYSQNLEDSQEEIKILTEKISQTSSRLTHPENYQEGLHKEIAQLRSECRRLRTQSHELSEENHHLKEDLWDLKMHHERLLAGKTDELSMENDWAASFFTGPFVGKLYSKNWRTEENRNDAFNVDGTFSKCKAALNSVNIKEPWESRHEERFKHNSSPFSMNSENTEVLIMASEDSFHNPSQTHTSGDACEDIHELSYDDDLSSVSHVRDNVLSNSSHSPKNSLLCDSSSKTEASKRPHLSMLPRRPFAPKNVGDLKLGDLVKFSRPGGKISKGTIQYKGHLPGRMEVYLGVELEGGELGKHDGIFQGVRYFLCKPNKGVFVNFSKIIMAWN
ncbi:uncharacterized protein LOC142141621 [Mixophyes fleayi]|uniref:uncharacterized protein LOC142141621 n=1 Tax=Mixophyes fleayi TaxID=3061075 RepID=UPI003F4E1CBB